MSEVPLYWSGKEPGLTRLAKIACCRSEIGNLLPNNQRQCRPCYALCHILFPVSAAHVNIFRMGSNSTSYPAAEAGVLASNFPPPQERRSYRDMGLIKFGASTLKTLLLERNCD